MIEEIGANEAKGSRIDKITGAPARTGKR